MFPISGCSVLAIEAVKFSSDQIIVVESVFQHWRYSIGFVHAHASYTQRRALWADIFALPTAPLLLIGDFNAALGAHERHSSVLPLRTSCQDFQKKYD